MKIGTRGSELALWQAHFTHDLLKQTTGIDAEIITIKTAGDRDLVTPLPEMSGKGFFTKEIEEALLDGRIDLAVHSLKDLQTQMPPGLEIGAVPARADRRDVLLIRPEAYERSKPLRLRQNVRVGTSSARRIAQLRFLRPDIEVESLRGNVPTRVRKLREGRYDAILVAAAGLDRLQLALDDLIAYRLPEQLIVPAPGQGALAVQVRTGDGKTRAHVEKMDQPTLRRNVALEREILSRLEGGCQLALGTAADETESGLRLTVFLGTDDPRRPRRIIVAGHEFDPVVGAAVNYLTGVAKPRSEQGPTSVWITREPQRAEEFRRLCDERRFTVSAISVFMAIEAGSTSEQNEVMKRLASYDWVFFTSQVTV
ncbi:MAG: hydroxymethylbilane synthase, partial [candidate division Zixibacteria bacterium]|nr:hydroxymethylbilane synthase [candidate division Zixibacteria bacterium]